MNKSDLQMILKVFRRLRIPFALVGGYAVAAWGVVRATRDIDFLASVSPERSIELVRELKKAGFKVDYRKGDEDDPVKGVIGLEPAKAANTEPVEIILGIKRMSACIFDRAQKIIFSGLEVPVAAPEDLIVLKCLAAGPVDIEDARIIFKIMDTKLDMEYLKSEFKRCRLSLEKLTNGAKLKIK